MESPKELIENRCELHIAKVAFTYIKNTPSKESGCLLEGTILNHQGKANYTSSVFKFRGTLSELACLKFVQHTLWLMMPHNETLPHAQNFGFIN